MKIDYLIVPFPLNCSVGHLNVIGWKPLESKKFIVHGLFAGALGSCTNGEIKFAIFTTVEREDLLNHPDYKGF